MIRSRILAWLAPAIVGLGALAGSAEAATGGDHPDFNGYWVISKDDEPNYPAFGRPGSEGMPRAWIVFNGYSAHGNTVPPLQPGLLDVVIRYMAREVAGAVEDEGSRKCLPSNNFDMMTRNEPIDVLQRPDQLVIIPEHERSLPRRIYIGGSHPADLKPSVNGHSVGHWEGETLVVDTIGLETSGFLFSTDYLRLSPALKVSERIHLEDAGKTLVFEWVFDDPKIFTRPWRMVSKFNKQDPTMEMFEDVCDLSNRRR